MSFQFHIIFQILLKLALNISKKTCNYIFFERCSNFFYGEGERIESRKGIYRGGEKEEKERGMNRK